MDFQELKASLQGFDINEIDLNNIGALPLLIKTGALALFFVLILVGGTVLYVNDLRDALQKSEAEEVTLRQDFESKAEQAVHLEAYRQQQKEMEVSFEAILRQLPSDTEIPGLIEDVTKLGHDSGLSFSSIDLQPERTHEFYIEKPIQIVVTGSYHGLGAFVSGVANLSRIVTLHNFSILPARGKRGRQARILEPDAERPGGLLTMQIQARTYRYKEDEG
jgi:type IV pilus assembly protein PilO